MSCFKLYIEATGEELQVREVPRLTKKVEELNEVGKIKTEGALGFTLEDTETNFRILSEYINPLKLDQNYAPVKVLAMIGSISLPLNQLYVLRYNQAFEVELRRAEDHWLDAAEKLKLNEIDFGEFLYDWQTIRDGWRFDWNYTDGDQGVYFQPCHYGRFIDGDRLNVGDLRPWFHTLAVLQKGFCQIGWEFESEVLQTTIGRISKCYILKENYDNRSEQPESRLLLETNGPYSTNGKIQWPTIVYDSDGVYSAGDISGNGEYRFTLRGKVSMTTNCNAGQFNRLQIIAVKTRQDGTLYTFPALVDQDFECNGTTQSEDYFFSTRLTETILPGESISFFIFGNRIDFELDASLNMELLTRYVEGALLPLNEGIKDDSFLDFFKGVLHLIGGLIQVDWPNRKIIVRPAFKGMWDMETYDGYFLEDGEIVEVRTEKNKESIQAPNTQPFRTYELKFQDSDEFVEQEYQSEYELFAKRIENLNSTTGEKIENKNPYFAPTLNGQYGGLIGADLAGIPGVSTAPYYLPHLWDNDQLETSRKIDPRIILSVYGKLNQQLPDGSVINPDILLNDLGPGGYAIINEYPIGWQKLVGYTVKDDNGKTWDKQGLFYGDKDYYDYSLFTLFWQKKLQNTFSNASVEALGYLGPSDFSGLNARLRHSVEGMGRMIIGFLSEVRDFDGCGDQTTPVVLNPIRQLSQACLEDEGVPPPDTCDNVISLEVTYNDPCYDFSVDTSGVNSPIDQIVFEYRYFDETTWTSANQLCNPDRAFYVRAQVLMDDDCPDLYDIKFLDPCGNIPEIVFNYNPDNDCLSIAIGGTISSAIENLNSTLEYQINGGAWQSYSTEICGETGEICARATVVYQDGCPSQDIDSCFTIPDEVTDCDLTTAGVECVDETGNFVSFNLTGTVANESQVLDDWILYREVGTDLWLRWNGELVPCPVEVKRRIIWCDNVCPPYCSETIICECDGCTQFNAGSPVNLALCN